MESNRIGSATAIASDVLLVGGGLANSLVALALRRAWPDRRIILLERAPAASAAHTWCVFRSDMTDAAWTALRPLFEPVWPGYDIAFPRQRRTLDTPYACLTGHRLARAVEDVLGADLHRGCDVVDLRPTSATCADGRVFTAPLVIDGRGQRPSKALVLAYQKFVGLEVTLGRPHSLDRPIVMDSCVAQTDGYRFVYTLPFGPRRLLIEDTRYSNGPDLDRAELETAVLAYAQARGWDITAVERREAGILPVALAGDIDAYLAEADPGIPVIGLRGALFHPTTGYSLPDAQRVADLIAAHPGLTSAALAPLLRRHAADLWKARRFYRMLNRMMMIAAAPEQRYRVLERFYALPAGLVERFYAGRLTLADKARILIGRPPVSVWRALRALPSSSARPHHA